MYVELESINQVPADERHTKRFAEHSFPPARAMTKKDPPRPEISMPPKVKLGPVRHFGGTHRNSESNSLREMIEQ